MIFVQLVPRTRFLVRSANRDMSLTPLFPEKSIPKKEKREKLHKSLSWLPVSGPGLDYSLLFPLLPPRTMISTLPSILSRMMLLTFTILTSQQSNPPLTPPLLAPLPPVLQ